MRETQARSLSPENPPKKERATRSSTLGWKFPGMEQRGRYSPRGRRVGHDRATSLPQQRPGDAAARLKGGPESRHASVWVSSALAFRSAENLLITSQVFLKPSEFDQTTATVQQKKSSASRPRGLFYKNRQLATWLQVSLKCQIQTGFQAYSSKKKKYT